MKKVIIDILPDGSVKLDAQGFKGAQCSVATREIELVLAGSGPVDDRKKPDFYAQNPQSHHNTNGGS